MINATIEAAFFACPVQPTADSLREYIDSLQRWAEITDNQLADVWVTRATQDVLIATGSYPLRPWLTQKLRETSVREYDANTVARLVETFFSRTSVLEDKSLISDLLFDSLTISPAIVAAGHPNELQLESEKAAVIIAILHGFAKGSQTRSSCLITEPQLNVRTVAVECQLSIVDHLRTDLTDLPNLPSHFTGTVPVGRQLLDCTLGLDEALILQEASNIAHIMDAVRISVCKHRFANRQTPESCLAVPSFRFHKHFFPCLQQCGIFRNLAHAKSTLRAIVETLEGIQMAATHALRTGVGADDPQITREKDSAWRRDIDRQYHLHYWKCPGNTHEFACLVEHNDFHICA